MAAGTARPGLEVAVAYGSGEGEDVPDVGHAGEVHDGALEAQAAPGGAARLSSVPTYFTAEPAAAQSSFLQSLLTHISNDFACFRRKCRVILALLLHFSPGCAFFRNPVTSCLPRPCWKMSRGSGPDDSS